MFEFLKTKRVSSQAAPSAETNLAPAQNTQQHNDIRRELIRVVLKDTLRANGIPTNWLACEVIIITRPQEGDQLHVQLVILKWHEKLLRYADAFQREFLLDLDRFDPTVDHSGYIVSWRFSPDCDCPFKELPDPRTWLLSAQAQVAEEPVPVLDRRRVPRDPHSARPDSPSTSRGRQPQEYAPTQVAPLR